MTRMMEFFTVLLCLALGGVICATQARADDYSQTTKLTFSGPVEIPGVVLPAGTYEFRIFDIQSDLDHVEVLDANGMHCITTFLAIPVTRPEPGRTLVTFEQRAPGAPEAIKDWFYLGDTTGHEFVYPTVKTEHSTGLQARK